MTKKFLVSLVLAGTLSAADWAPPAANQGSWAVGTNVGVPGGIAQYLAGGANDRAVTGTVVDITAAPYNADNTGTNDVRGALVDALAAASSGTVIYFPAGTYRFDSGFVYADYKDNITIRGAGPSLTTFYCSIADHPIFIFSSPGLMDNDVRTITGTKTKGTSTLAISNTTNYAVGKHVAIKYENETNLARIQAGAAPVWHSIGAPFIRAMTAKITAVSVNTSITIEPPIPGDGTDLVMTAGIYAADNKSTGWGFEDFSVSFDSTQHPRSFIAFDTTEYSWVHNVKFLDWSKTSSSGSCVQVLNSYGVEVSKCVFTAVSGSSSDGGIGSGSSTSCLFVDNIFTGPWDVLIYDNGNACNNVIAYNFGTGSNGTLFHNAHPSLNLFEGNSISGHHSDGYHGSGSHNTLYRNHLKGGFAVILNRFKRNYVMSGNIFGTDGTSSGVISWGNPNMGNGAADGFAGPTGASTQVGQIDYLQPGYAPNTYVIVSGDVAVGDFWQDWNVTATLTTRTSDLEGVFAVSGGNWFTGPSSTGGGNLLVYARWDSGNNYVYNGTVTNVAGSNVTISFAGGSLPAASSAVSMYFGPSGWQERDLDVQASSTLVHNYWASSSGTGSIQDSTGSTLPASLAYSAKPDWFGNLAWPPFNPDDASTQAAIRLPAGYRYENGNEDYLVGGGVGGITADMTAINSTTLNLSLP